MWGDGSIGDGRGRDWRGEAGRFQGAFSALHPGGAPGTDHPYLFHLAGFPSALSVPAAGRCVRAEVALRLVRELRRSFRRPGIPAVHASDRGVQRLGRLPGAYDCPLPGRPGRPGDQGRHRLSDPASVALCRGAGGGGCAVSVSVQPDIGAGYAVAPGHGARLEPRASRRSGHDAGNRRRHLEADQLQFPVLPGRHAGDPPIPDRSRGHRRRPPLKALLDHRFPRC